MAYFIFLYGLALYWLGIQGIKLTNYQVIVGLLVIILIVEGFKDIMENAVRRAIRKETNGCPDHPLKRI